MSSTDVPSTSDVISNKQSIFFQSDPHAAIPNKLANNASDAFFQLISDKPSHTPDSKN